MTDDLQTLLRRVMDLRQQFVADGGEKAQAFEEVVGGLAHAFGEYAAAQILVQRELVARYHALETRVEVLEEYLMADVGVAN